MKKQAYLTVLAQRILFLIFSIVLFPAVATAQGFVSSKDKDIEWRLIGRVFFDGGAFFDDNAKFGNGFQVNDVRLGTIVRVMEDWEIKLEAGYANKDVSFRDVFMGYKKGKHSFQLGYFHESYGSNRVGTSNHKFMSSAPADNILGNPRKPGISYTYNVNHFNLTGGIFSGGNIDNGKLMKQGYSFAAKLIGRPVNKDKQVLHLAVASVFSDHSSEVSFAGGVPTTLLSNADNCFVKMGVSDAINQRKIEGEIIGIYNKWYLEGHYLFANVNRAFVDNYNVWGYYGQVGYMVFGVKHNYNSAKGMVVNPTLSALEVLLRYDRVNLNGGDLRGGKLGDITLGVNYYINRFIAAKLNYIHMMVDKTAPAGRDKFGLVQGRLQFSF